MNRRLGFHSTKFGIRIFRSSPKGDDLIKPDSMSVRPSVRPFVHTFSVYRLFLPKVVIIISRLRLSNQVVRHY